MSEVRLGSGLDPNFAANYTLEPVEHDPFAAPGAPIDRSGYTPIRGGSAPQLTMAGLDGGPPIDRSGYTPIRGGMDLAGALAGPAPAPGYFGQIGQDISDFLAQPVAHVRQRLADIGQSFGDVARGYIGGQAALQSADYSGQPLVGVGPGGELTGRIPALAEQFTSGMAGPVPGGALGAGPAILGRAARAARAEGGAVAAPTAAEAAAAPFDAIANTQTLADQLRAAHLARGDQALPLSGARMPVAPPPHIQSMDDVDALVNRYVDLAQEGEAARNWYLESGRAIARATNDQETAGKFTSAIARTSPQTDVATNLTHAITLHNQAQLGEPLSAGRFPAAMGADVERYYYGNQPVTGEKIAPFHNALDVGWNPDFPHTYVNDVWNMRALEYPGENWRVYNQPGGWGVGTGKLYDDTPTLGQHNFTRIIADRALDELERRTQAQDADGNPIPGTGQRWDPKELQAASWAAIKSRVEGDPLDVTAQNYATGLQRNYAQASWESAPGMSSDHLPEFHTAPLEDRQAFHNDIRSVLVDDQGNDIIHRHLGLLTGPSFDAPGYFRGAAAPGTQAPVALGQAPGGMRVGVDPASRTLMNVGEAVRGLLLRQDASAWLKPSWSAALANKDLNQSNLADIRIGRPLTMDEAGDVGNAMQRATGSDFFSPIATQQGYRLYNVPSETGLTNRQFWDQVRGVVTSGLHPDADIVHARADGNYIPNDWRENPGGENFVGEIRRTGRPDVQRAAAELLATLGPRIQQVEDRWEQTHGWTPNRASRIWENNPIIQGYAGAVVPNPPRPWVQRPAPPGYGSPPWRNPPLFSGAPSPMPPALVPVEHDPFSPQSGA